VAKIFKALTVDEARYQRFSESNTAFNALSRDRGSGWQMPFARRQRDLAIHAKASPKETIVQREDALIQYALIDAMDRINVMTANWGSGKCNRGGLKWEPADDWFAEEGVERPADAARLTRALRFLARDCGAVSTGVAPFDPRWIYSETQRNHCQPGEPDTQPILIDSDGIPFEDEAGLHLPSTLRNVIVCAVPMHADLISTAPSLYAEAATSQGYSLAACVCLSVAEFCRSLGYQAIASLNGTALSIPIAVQAGLGEVGRNGMLITPEYGPCIRLCKVYTDMPLEQGTPRDLGIQAYCQVCGACARACPSHAIPSGEPTWEGANECNSAGVLKWHVNAKQCLRYWVAAGSSCSACIAVCPFSGGKGWFSGLPQRLIARTTRWNRIMAWLDRRWGVKRRRQTSDQVTPEIMP